MNGLADLSDMAFDWGIIPGQSIVTGVLDIFKTQAAAEAAQTQAAAQASLQAQQQAQQQANTALQLVEQRRKEEFTQNILMGVAAVGVLGVAALIAYKAVSKKGK